MVSSKSFRNYNRVITGLSSLEGAADGPLASTTILFSQLITHFYTFFSSLNKADTLGREQAIRLFLGTLALGQLAATTYLFFSDTDCVKDKKDTLCKMIFYINALRLGLQLTTNAMSEISKRPFEEEQKLRSSSSASFSFFKKHIPLIGPKLDTLQEVKQA